LKKLETYQSGSDVVPEFAKVYQEFEDRGILDSTDATAQLYYEPAQLPKKDVVNGYLRFDDGITYFLLKIPVKDVSFKCWPFRERSFPENLTVNPSDRVYLERMLGMKNVPTNTLCESAALHRTTRSMADFAVCLNVREL